MTPNAIQLKLLATVLKLQQYTSTAANVIPIPDGDRVIAVGTPAEVTRLLEIVPAAALTSGINLDKLLPVPVLWRREH